MHLFLILYLFGLLFGNDYIPFSYFVYAILLYKTYSYYVCNIEIKML